MSDKQKKYDITQEKIEQPLARHPLAISLHIDLMNHVSHAQVIFHCVITCLGSLYFGYAMGELNMAQKKLNMAYNISEDNENTYQGILNSVMPLGAAIGSVITGSLLKTKGRRPIILFADFVGILNCLLFLIANFWVAAFARLVMGFIVGINSTIIPLYVREISPLQLFSKTEVLNQVFLNSGIFLAYIIGLGFPIDEQELEDQSGFYWRFALLFPIIPCGIRGFFFLFVYKQDTIIHFLQIGEEEKAKKLISDYYTPSSCVQVFESYNQEVESKKKLDNSWSYIFTRIYISRTLLGCLIFFFLQFSGINAFVFYSSDIFEETLGSKSTANIMTVVCGIEMVILGFLSSSISKRYGRKKIFLYGLSILACINIMAGIVSYIVKDDEEADDTSSVFLIASIFLYYLVFNLTIGPLSWVYSAEINCNENAVGLATCVNWLCSFFIGLIFPLLTNALGVYSVFWIFAGFCIVGFFYFLIFAKETLGKTAEQIIKIFENKQETQQIIKTHNSLEDQDHVQHHVQETEQQIQTNQQIQDINSQKNTQKPN